MARSGLSTSSFTHHFYRNFHPFLEFYSFARLPLQLAADETSAKPWPPDWRHLECLATVFSSLPRIGSNAATVAASDRVFASDFSRHRHSFGPISGVGEPPLSDLTTPTASPCLELQFETTHDHHRATAIPPFSAVFWQAEGRTPPITMVIVLPASLAIDPDRRQPQPHRCRHFSATGSARPVRPIYPRRSRATSTSASICPSTVHLCP